MAVVRSSWSLLERVTGKAPSLGGASPVVDAGYAGSGSDDTATSAGRLLRAGGLLALRFLALALDAGLLIVLASASLGQNAALLDLLVEAPQGTLEGLVFSYADFSQSGIASRRPNLRPSHARRRGPSRGEARERGRFTSKRYPRQGPPQCTRTARQPQFTRRGTRRRRLAVMHPRTIRLGERENTRMGPGTHRLTAT